MFEKELSVGAHLVRTRFPGLRSGMIVPGVNPKHLEKAAASNLDLLHIELEDGINDDRKQEAREVTLKALLTLDFGGKITMPRINNVHSGYVEEDIDVVAEGRPTCFLLAKCGGPEDIHYIDHLITKAERKHKIPVGTIKIASMIERARGLLKVDEIAVASDRMMALYIGPTDLSTEVGYRRTYQGDELETLWPRSRVVFAAHAANLLAIDSPTTYYTDLELTLRQAKWSYHLGFDLKTCVSPRQIDMVNRGFTPSDEETSWAHKVFEGKEEAEAKGLSVWVRDGMMIDEAMVSRAQHILATAEKAKRDVAFKS
jgi:citrate lyase subunit beta/citryl-CoA lyase